MPVFEYQCLDCGRVFEMFTQRRDRSAATKCPDCGKENIERILSPFSGRTSRGGSCTSSSAGFA